MFEFEFFNPTLGPLSVSIAQYGLTFSRAAVEQLGKPEYIKLGFDKNNLIVGVAAAEKEDTQAIPFMAKEKNGYVRINSKDFIRFLMRYFPEDYEQRFSEKSIRYLTYWDESFKMLIVDLKVRLDKNDEAESVNEDA
ncbi:MAG: hypothetical protein GX660_05220 [Clostridiaceae bacterium]|nr:hypothetical protein [Clostridiaceae bacterium]